MNEERKKEVLDRLEGNKRRVKDGSREVIINGYRVVLVTSCHIYIEGTDYPTDYAWSKGEENDIFAWANQFTLDQKKEFKGQYE